MAYGETDGQVSHVGRMGICDLVRGGGRGRGVGVGGEGEGLGAVELGAVGG